jgi:hypothetical protein
MHGAKLNNDNILPNRHLLVKKVGSRKVQIINFGDFAQGHISSLTNYYSFNEKQISHLSNSVKMFIDSVNKWLDLTNGEFIVDFVKTFRIKKSDSEWL